jgi:hypothetical protein
MRQQCTIHDTRPRPGRSLAAASIPLAAAAVALLLAPNAAADGNDYLNQLAGAGVTDANGPDGLIGLGDSACTDIEHGYSNIHEIEKLIAASAVGAQNGRQTPVLTPHQASTIVLAATTDLCPGAEDRPVAPGN